MIKLLRLLCLCSIDLGLVLSEGVFACVVFVCICNVYSPTLGFVPEAAEAGARNCALWLRFKGGT